MRKNSNRKFFYFQILINLHESLSSAKKMSKVIPYGQFIQVQIHTKAYLARSESLGQG